MFDPAELLERLAALVPRPRSHLLVYHGLLAPPAEWRSAIVPVPEAGAARPSGVVGPDGPRPPGRLSWPMLLRRVFSREALACPHCGGPRRILGAMTEPHAVRRLLAALGLAAEPPPRLQLRASA